jgi:hypothetical protein
VYGRSSEQTASVFSFGAILCGFKAPACMTGEKGSILQPSRNLLVLPKVEYSLSKTGESLKPL